MKKHPFGVKKVYKVGHFELITDENGNKAVRFLDEDSKLFADVETALHYLVGFGYKLLRKPIEVDGIKLLAIDRTDAYGIHLETYAGVVACDIEGL